MAIPLMEDDVEIISKLGDAPGSDDGLTAQQLKNRFDLAGVRIKNFINSTLIPYLNQLVDVQALLDSILDPSLSAADKAAPAKTVGDKLVTITQTTNAALARSGGVMTGALNMNNQQLTGIRTPTAASHAVNKAYVDTVTVSVKLNATDWSGSAAPFTQAVAVEGLSDDKFACVHPVYPGAQKANLAMKEACACVGYAKRSGQTITFYCLEEKPSVNIPIEVEVSI